MKLAFKITLLFILVMSKIFGMAPEESRMRIIEELLSKPDVVVFAKGVCERVKKGSGVLSHRSPSSYITVHFSEQQVSIYQMDFPGVPQSDPTLKMNIVEFCQTVAQLREKNRMRVPGNENT